MLRQVSALLAVFLAAVSSAAGNNPFGIMLMTDGDADTAGMLHHMRLARELCGEWGYVRIGSGFERGSVEALERVVAGCRAMHLIPVLTAMRLPDSYYDPVVKDVPLRDPDGTLTSFERAYEDWLRQVYARGVTIPYFEYGNEVNGGYFEQHPEVYADALIACSRAFKRVDPSISIGTAGMAGCALEFYERLLKARPELKDHVGHWGFHPYAANHPPGYSLVYDDYAVECNTLLGDLLKRHGVKEPVLIATETGYELGNQRDRRFPRITESLRADYLARAYTGFWLKDPHVRAVMPFMLMDVRWSNWNGWDFIREDYSLTPMYQTIRDLPKPAGRDYLPAGNCSLKGRVVSDEGWGVPDCIVWVRRPGGPCYAAVTDGAGDYVVQRVPPGEYTVSAVRDGFAGDSTTVVLREAQHGAFDCTMRRTGLLSDPDGPPGAGAADGWTPSGQGGFHVDASVKRKGRASQRVSADGGPAHVWKVSAYESVLPGRSYVARVYVRGSDVILADRKGVWLGLAMVDSYNRPIVEGEVTLDAAGSFGWSPLTLACAAPPTARRIRVTLGVDAQSGTVWFDDVFLHDASWPLPETAAPSKVCTISGVVKGYGGQQILQGASVSASPGGYVCRTDLLGRFSLSVPPGRYKLTGMFPGLASTSSAWLDVREKSGSAGHEIVLQRPSAPGSIQCAGFEDIPRVNTWFTGWQRYGTTEGINANGWHRESGIPEHPDGFSAHSGKGFFGVVAGSNIKDGGIYQTIAVEPDALYEVSVWSYTYQTGEGGARGDVANRLGVDPTGGTDPSSAYVLWTPFTASQRRWTQLRLQVRPVGDRLTVFLHHLQVHGLLFNCNLFDDVDVRRLGPPNATLDMEPAGG